jgi:hypothetical protein
MAFFGTNNLGEENLFIKLSFSHGALTMLNMLPESSRQIIKGLLMMFRTPRFADSIVQLSYSLLAPLSLHTLMFKHNNLRDQSKSRDIINLINFNYKKRMLIALLVIILLAGSATSWSLPTFFRGSIWDAQDLALIQSLETFLAKYGREAALQSILLNSIAPRGQTAFYLFPFRPIWQADGTVANYVYNYLRYLIYVRRDLSLAFKLLRLIGVKYILVNTEVAPDEQVRSLFNSSGRRLVIFIFMS